jgi:uncharacterized cupin superfamily protein
LIVVSGEVTLRSPEGERVLTAGDTVCFPIGERGLHSMRNDSDEPARYLMPSSRPRHGYVAVRPESNTAVIVGPGFSSVVSLEPARDFWEGEP